MKKSNVKLFLFAFIFAFGCASTPAPQTKTDAGIDVSSLNKQLSGSSIGGFVYKSSKLDNANWDRWATKAAPIVKEILNKLPEGYVLQATGHTDASGPEDATGDKPGNNKISTDRAKTVYDALKRANISSPKVTYKGMGSDEPLSEFDPKAPEQRRVSFKIVSK